MNRFLLLLSLLLAGLSLNAQTTIDTFLCAAPSSWNENPPTPFTWHGHDFYNFGSWTDPDNGVTYNLKVIRIDFTPTHIDCYGASTGGASISVIGGTTPYNCSWSSGEIIVSTTPVLTNQPAGLYVVTVTDATGCNVSAQVRLTQPDSMIAGEITAPSVCRGTTDITLTGTPASGGPDDCVYQWEINGVPRPNSNTQDLNYSDNDLTSNNISFRRAWVSATCGTVYSNELSINVLPVYDITIQASVCQNTPYQEYGFDIAATETATPALITRTQQLQSMDGCDSSVTLSLTVKPVYDTTFKDTVCEGSGYNKYGFNVQAPQTIGVPELNLTQNLQSREGCDSVVKLRLTVIDTAIAIVSLIPDFCEYRFTELSVNTSLTNYRWSTDETSQTIEVKEPGTYTVTAYEASCSAFARYQIEPCEINIYLPNAISPGVMDDLNDYFCLDDSYLPMIETLEVSIYNRWGELAFHSTDKAFKWNEGCQGCIYTYYMIVTDVLGTHHKLKGTVMVL